MLHRKRRAPHIEGSGQQRYHRSSWQRQKRDIVQRLFGRGTPCAARCACLVACFGAIVDLCAILLFAFAPEKCSSYALSTEEEDCRQQELELDVSRTKDGG